MRIEQPKTKMLKMAIVAVLAVAFIQSTVFSETFSTWAAQEKRSSETRFDIKVRNDFFAGFAGNREALDRGMKACEETLAANPKHAEALVWHGGGLGFLSGLEFQKSNIGRGMELWQKGLEEMNHAVELEPNNIGVRIPRGASLLESSKYVRMPEVAKQLLQTGLTDYEKVLELQKSYFDKLSVHARGELLSGLGEGYSRLGDQEKAKTYYKMMLAQTRNSPYEERAKTWLETGSLKASPHGVSCIGCHTE